MEITAKLTPLYETNGGDIHDADGKPLVKGLSNRREMLPFIVQACNMHDELVMALKSVKMNLGVQGERLLNYGSSIESVLMTLSLIDKVLAKAGAK